MKKFILAVLLISFTAFSQTTATQGSANTQIANPGGYEVAKVLRVPRTDDNTLFPLISDQGRIRYNPTSDYFEMHDGTSWKRIVDSAFLATQLINNIPAQYFPSINSTVTRALNTDYTISTTRAAKVTYTIRIAYTLTVLLGSTGVVDLQYSINSGSTWITVSTISNNLNLGIALTGYNDFVLYGDIPANALVRLNSSASNATNTYRTGQEIY